MTAEIVDTSTGEITESPTPYQLLPRLTDDEYADLRADIAESGIRVPIDVDEDGTILDGHHRAWIAGDLGVECPRRIVTGLTDEQKRGYAVAVNVHRRNLTRDQRRELVARLRQDGMSVRAIAKATRASTNTVLADLSQTETPAPSIVTGQDGKTYPSRSKVTTTRTERETVEVSPGPSVPQRRQVVDVSRAVNGSLAEIDTARRRLSALTPAHLRSQSDEARSSWAANLAEQLEALHGFFNALNNKEK